MAMNNNAPRTAWAVTPQIVFGLAIVFFGLVLTAKNLGFAPNVTRIFQFWPMVFTAAGLAMVLDRDSARGRKVWGGLLIVAGLWQTANTAFGLGFYIDEWWPLGLVALGGFLVYRSMQHQQAMDSSATDGAGSHSAMGGATSMGGVAPMSDTRADMVTVAAFMSGVKRNNVSPSFRRANLTAIMGGIEFDLRQCTATGGESIIDVFTIWGGIQLRIPADWEVVSEVMPIMGGVDDRSGHVQPARHRLVLKGAAIMGGVEVKS
jgi:hypothetical protein